MMTVSERQWLGQLYTENLPEQ